MSSPNHLKDILRGWETVMMFGLLGLIFALLVSFLQPLKYSSTARLLILQNVGTSVDAYTASRSEERIAENLSTIVYTSSFFDELLRAGFPIDETYFPEDPSRKRRAWGQTVKAVVTRGSGLLTITAYHADVSQAEQIVRAIVFVLTEHVDEYTSAGSVDVRLVDEPLNSRWPTKPNIPSNIASGFFFGLLIGAAYVLLKTERIRRQHQLD